MAKIGRVPTYPETTQMPSTPTQDESPGWLDTLGSVGGSVWDAVQGAGSAAGDAAVSVTDFLGGIDPMSMCLLAPIGNSPAPSGGGLLGGMLEGVDPMSMCLLAPMIDPPALCLGLDPLPTPMDLCLGLEPFMDVDPMSMCLMLPTDFVPGGGDQPGSITSVLDGVDPMSMCLLTALDPVQNAASAVQGMFSGW